MTEEGVEEPKDEKSMSIAQKKLLLEANFMKLIYL